MDLGCPRPPDRRSDPRAKSHGCAEALNYLSAGASAAGSVRVLSLRDASDDRFAAKDARAFAKSAQDTAICSQVCFCFSLAELCALIWHSLALAAYASLLA